MLWVLFAEIGLLILLGIPAVLVYKRWVRWVDRLSPYQRPFEHSRRFGVRSWAARAFVVTSSPIAVKERINALGEITLENLLKREEDKSSLLSMATMFGKSSFPTGIQVEWLDQETADLRARMYADWPENLEDSVRLPLRQRQMLAEHAVIYIKPEDDRCTKIEYEIEKPMWVYILSGALILLALWTAWGASNLVRILTPSHLQSALLPWLYVNTAVFGAALACVIGTILPILKLQSISLFDNVIAGFGEIISPRNHHFQK
ncbi:MAG: hypothetical protein K6T99_07260 [Armatimonadetes bacterium]|nr:hypothetical protein [Armatimonadota bacterium]